MEVDLANEIDSDSDDDSLSPLFIGLITDYVVNMHVFAFQYMEMFTNSPTLPASHKMSPHLQSRVLAANSKLDNMKAFMRQEDWPIFDALGRELQDEYETILHYMKRESPVKRGTLREIVADFGMFRYE